MVIQTASFPANASLTDNGIIETQKSTVPLWRHAKRHGHAPRECRVGMFWFTVFCVGVSTPVQTCRSVCRTTRDEFQARSSTHLKGWRWHEIGQGSNCGVVRQNSFALLVSTNSHKNDVVFWDAIWTGDLFNDTGVRHWTHTDALSKRQPWEVEKSSFHPRVETAHPRFKSSTDSNTWPWENIERLAVWSLNCCLYRFHVDVMPLRCAELLAGNSSRVVRQTLRLAWTGVETPTPKVANQNIPTRHYWSVSMSHRVPSWRNRRVMSPDDAVIYQRRHPWRFSRFVWPWRRLTMILNGALFLNFLCRPEPPCVIPWHLVSDTHVSRLDVRAGNSVPTRRRECSDAVVDVVWRGLLL